MKVKDKYLSEVSLVIGLAFLYGITECQGAVILKVKLCNEYNYTDFPNIFNHTTQEQAIQHMYTFWPLLVTFCSNDLVFFTCLVHFPARNSLRSTAGKRPCRSLCEDVVNNCAYSMNMLQFQWPEEISCDKFPTTDCTNKRAKDQGEVSTNSSCSATTRVPICSSIRTSQTSDRLFFGQVNNPFANYFKHSVQTVAIYELSKHTALVNLLTALQVNPAFQKNVTPCVNELTYLLCTTYLPRCGEKSPREYAITKSQCENTLGPTCKTAIELLRKEGYVIQWPPVSIDCGAFPVKQPQPQIYFKRNTFAGLSPPPPALTSVINGSNFLQIKWKAFPVSLSVGLTVETGFIYKPAGSKTKYRNLLADKGSTSVILQDLSQNQVYEVFAGTVNNDTLSPGGLAKILLKTGTGIEQVSSPFCLEFYNFTGFPNVFGHENQVKALFEMHSFFPLLDTMCSADLKAFMCSAFLPHYSSASKIKQSPCQSLCRKVFDRCSYARNKLNFKWPKELECEKFTDEQSKCYKPASVSGKPIVDSDKCVETEEQSICSLVRTRKNQLYFTTVGKTFKNYFNHTSQQQAVYELSKHAKLLGLLSSVIFNLQGSPFDLMIQCVHNLTYLLCSLHIPNCPDGVRLTKTECRKVLNLGGICFSSIRDLRRLSYVVDWPPVQVSCDSFPDRTAFNHQFGPITFTNPKPPPPSITFTTVNPSTITLEWKPYPVKRFGGENGSVLLYRPVNSDNPFQHIQGNQGNSSVMIKNFATDKDHEIFVGVLDGKSGVPGRLNRIIYVSRTSVYEIPINIPCVSFYRHTILPNTFGDKSIDTSKERMFQFFPLIYTLCSEELYRFACAVHLPRYNISTSSRQPLCRSACERVFKSCSYAIQRSKFRWPDELKCEKFNDDTPCYDLSAQTELRGDIVEQPFEGRQPAKRRRRALGSPEQQCKPVQSNLICTSVKASRVSPFPSDYFNQTFMNGRSNYFNHTSTDEAIFELSKFLPLLSSLRGMNTKESSICSTQLAVLLCHLHLPLCPRNTQTVTQKECNDTMNTTLQCFKAIAELNKQQINFVWPPVQVNCLDDKWFSNSTRRPNYFVQPISLTPGPPKNVQVTFRSSDQMSIGFTPNFVSKTRLEVGVLYREKNVPSTYTVQKTTNNNVLELKNLTSGKIYEMKVASLDRLSGFPGIFITLTNRTYDENVYDIPSSIDTCYNIYKHTILPNRLGDRSIKDAQLSMIQFFPLMYTLCSEKLPQFICAVHLPLYNTTSHSRRPVCRSACEKVFKSCSYAIRQSNFFWPEELKCDKFNNELSCYDLSRGGRPATYFNPENTLTTPDPRLIPRAVDSKCRPIEPNFICSSVEKETPQKRDLRRIPSGLFGLTFSTGQLNYFDHSSTEEAIYELSRYLPLLSTLWAVSSDDEFSTCAKSLTVLLCHLHVPVCPLNTHIVTRKTCLQIMSNTSSCFKAITKLNRQQENFKWPPVQVNCLDDKWFSNSTRQTDYLVQKNPGYPLPPPNNVKVTYRSSKEIFVRNRFIIIPTKGYRVMALYRQNGSNARYSVYSGNSFQSQFLRLTSLAPGTDYEINLATLNLRSGFPGVFTGFIDNTFGQCPAEKTGDNATQGIFSWNPTSGNSFSQTNCPYGPSLSFEAEIPESQLGLGKNRPTRACRCRDQGSCKDVYWLEPQTRSCYYKVFNDSNITQELTDILQTLVNGKRTVLNASKALLNVTSRAPEFQPVDVTLATITLENIAGRRQHLNETGSNIVTTVNNILNAAYDILAQSQKDSNSSARILRLLEKYLENIPLEIGANVTQNEQNVAVFTKVFNSSNFQGAGAESLSNSPNVQAENTFAVHNNDDSVRPQISQVSLTIPQSIFETLNIDHKSQSQRISFIVFRKTSLFQSQNKSAVDTDTETVRKKNSFVIAGSIKGQNVENLTDPVVSTYRPLEAAVDESSACVFWDFGKGGGVGDWSEVGCAYQSTVNGIVTCHCYHLTNFAILMDVYIEDHNEDAHDKALSIISYIGCAVSLVGLILTIITILIFKELRRKVPTQILLNFCIALSLTLIVFIVAAERSKASSLAACRAGAIALHYFVLAVFMWMAIEAFNMYLAFVKVMPKHFPRFMLKCCIVGWGLPAIIVIITAALAIDDYGDETFCRLQGLPFQLTFLAPVLLILVGNSVAFVLILRSLLTSRSKVSADSRISGLKQARRGTAILIVLGLTWMFGVLAIRDAKLVFQYLFCIFNSIQGLLVFIFYCVLSVETRTKYKKLFYGKGKGRDTETGPNRYHASTSDSRFHEVKPKKNAHSDTFTGSSNMSDSTASRSRNVELKQF